MKKIAILGSTGSIGTQTLDIVRKHPDLFKVVALAANKNDILLEKQILEFQPEVAVLSDMDASKRLKKRYLGKTNILSGADGLESVAADTSAEIVVTSLMGFAGLRPTLAALKAGKSIALANKETLVVAGELVLPLAKQAGVQILPVDSEHGAIFQCLMGNKRSLVDKLWITASGGPFRTKKRADLCAVTVKECLSHPTWSMGRKITID